MHILQIIHKFNSLRNKPASYLPSPHPQTSVKSALICAITSVSPLRCRRFGAAVSVLDHSADFERFSNYLLLKIERTILYQYVIYSKFLEIANNFNN